MLNILLSRLRQGHHTNNYPLQTPAMPLRYRGLPRISAESCLEVCGRCVTACPVKAITQDVVTTIDLGKCLFCTACMEACPTGSIAFSRDHRLAVRERSHLKLAAGAVFETARSLDGALQRMLGRSLNIRVVSAGGCNGCEVDVNVLQTIAWDIKRFGMNFVASPRHADAVLICGPVTQNMKDAVQKTIDAMPEPKLLIAAGTCAISGGIYADRPEQCNGCEALGYNVDLFIPGCPPHPLTILDGLLRLLGRIL